MDYLAKAVNAVKDGYLYVIDGIAKNPQTTFWAGSGLVVVLAII